MLEWIFILLLGAVILLFFHNQVTFEYKVAQIRWDQKETQLASLLAERTPLVIQGVPPVAFWTLQDIQRRAFYQDVPIFEDQGLREWLNAQPVDTTCPWTREHATLLGALSGLGVWAERELHPAIHTNPLWSLWYRPEVSCWAGARPLWKTSCRWTCIVPTEGALLVSILAGSAKTVQSLPPSLANVFPNKLTVYDTPFVADLQYMDIVVRQGSCLVMPPHWFMSWQALEGSEQVPLVCLVEYHTPVSLLLRTA